MNVTKRIRKPDDEATSQLDPEPAERPEMQNTHQNLSMPEIVKYAISALFLLMGVGIVIGLSMLRESNAKGDSDSLIPQVITHPVGNFQGNLDLLLSGTVVPFREIEERAQVSGKIVTKYTECEAGTFVKKGTPLIQIDPVDYELEIKTVQSEILQAQRTIQETEQDIRGAIKSLEIAKTELQLHQNEYNRRLRLKSSLSPTEMDQAKRNLLSGESQLTTRKNTYDSLLARKESLKASLELNQIRLERAELNLQRTTVVAPVDGVIVRESVEKGSFVAVSNPLFVIEDTSRSEVVCNLTPGELSWLKQHADDGGNAARHFDGVYDVPRVGVEVFEQNAPSVIWSGTLERFDGIGRNLTTKSIPCRIVVEDPVSSIDNEASRVLVRGMFVKCRVALSAAQGLELAEIPLIAIRPGDYVWVVRNKELTRINVDVVDRTPITGKRKHKMVAVELANGLQLGDAIVISPLPQPVEGGRVELKVPEPQASENATQPVADSESGDQPSNQNQSSDEPESTNVERSCP